MIIEIIGIIIAVSIGLAGLFKYLLDCLDQYLSKQLQILEGRIILEINLLKGCFVHCKELRTVETKELIRRISDIENYLDKHETLDFKIRHRNNENNN